MTQKRDPFRHVATGGSVEIYAISRWLRLARLARWLWCELTRRP